MQKNHMSYKQIALVLIGALIAIVVITAVVAGGSTPTATTQQSIPSSDEIIMQDADQVQSEYMDGTFAGLHRACKQLLRDDHPRLAIVIEQREFCTGYEH
jgi:hypothetical protein